MMTKRTIAICVIVAVIGALVAGVFLGPPTVAWLSGGTLAALVVGALSPQGRSQLTSRTRAPVVKGATESRLKLPRIERWQALTALSALLLLVIPIALENPSLGGESSSATSIFSRHTIGLLCTELAFALIIALAIAITIEKRARERDHAAHEAMRKRIAEDVFRGVFSSQLPPEYINAVVDRTLKVRLVRPWIRIIEDLSEIESETATKFKLEPRGLLRCDRLIEYALHNVTTKPISETLQVFFPIKRIEVSDLTGMDFLSIGDRRWDHFQTSELRVRQNDPTAIRYEFPIELQPGETVDVKLHTRHFKYHSDSEIWSTIYATMRFDLIFRCSVSLQSLGLRSSSLQPVSSEYLEPERGIGNWTVEGPLLPGDSLTYWWSANEVHDVR